jgi:hypothetical protein
MLGCFLEGRMDGETGQEVMDSLEVQVWLR